ncbi:hypothetical protein RJ55_04535 [Drechmeria coniospora]|nr:hypothetical protein RJ55_04535 [Drechmeria coniospora]
MSSLADSSPRFPLVSCRHLLRALLFFPPSRRHVQAGRKQLVVLTMTLEKLNLDSRSLSPLPSSLRGGLIAIAVLALVSFVACATLFVYLTTKLVAWRYFLKEHPSPPSPQVPASPPQPTTEFTLGIDGIFKGPPRDGDQDDAASDLPSSGAVLRSQPVRKPPNQFLVLIYNLFLADMHQSLAFLLNAIWLRRDGILVGTSTCWSQGFFVSTGNLASSMFIMSIAIHTYMSVVEKRRPRQRFLYLSVVAIWLFVYLVSLLPVALTRNGEEHGGFYVRVGAWCSMNKEYENLRLATHYLFIILALTITSALYVTTFISLRRPRTRARKTVDPDGEAVLTHKTAFLIYPAIYVACTMPLAFGRIATMAGQKLPLGFFYFAGAMIAFNGFFDCLLFGSTRNVLIFGLAEDLGSEDTGVKTFAFLQTPKSRQFGNLVWIEGGRAAPAREDPVDRPCFWHRLRNGRRRTEPWPRQEPRNTSRASLRSTAIHMDTVMSVVVEAGESNQHQSYPRAASAATSSLKSADEVYIS